jgi:hypothetical protein
MSLSLDSTNEVKVVKSSEVVEEVKDLSLESSSTDVNFSELSETVSLIPKEYLTPVDGREAFDLKYNFGASQLSNLTLKTKSGFISNFIKEAFDKEKTTKEIPVPNGSRLHLEMIVRYLEHQDGLPGKIPSKPITSKKMSEIVSDPWIAKYCDDLDCLELEGKKFTLVECRDFLYELLTLANYLHIECLIHILAAKVASLIRGTPGEQMKGVLLGTGEVEPKKPKQVVPPKEEKEEKKEEKKQ